MVSLQPLKSVEAEPPAPTPDSHHLAETLRSAHGEVAVLGSPDGKSTATTSCLAVEAEPPTPAPDP